MGRAALAQVQLDRVRRPRSAGLSDDHEVDREPPSAPSLGEPLPDLLRVPGDEPRVLRGGRKDASEVLLPARPAEQLVVGREQLDLPLGRTRSCTLGLCSSCPVIRSSTIPRPRRTWQRRRRTACLGLQVHVLRSASSPRPSRRPSPDSEARSGSRRRFRPGDAFVELDDGAGHGGRCRRISTTASAISSRLCRFSAPNGWGTPTSAKSDGIRSSIRARPAGGQRRTSGCQGSARRRAPGPSCCTAPGGSAPGWARGPRSGAAAGRSSLLAERAPRGVVDRDEQSRPARGSG